jgi:hypothetical protein
MQRADSKPVMTSSGGTFTMPRLIRTAPNGDPFLADSSAGISFVLRADPAEILRFAASGGDPEIVRLILDRIDWPHDDSR